MLPIKDRGGTRNQFPEERTSRGGSPFPFPRSLSHTQLVFVDEQDNNGHENGLHHLHHVNKMDNEQIFLQEQEEGLLTTQERQRHQPENVNYFHEQVESLSNSMGYLNVRASGGAGGRVETLRSNSCINNYGRSIANSDRNGGTSGLLMVNHPHHLLHHSLQQQQSQNLYCNVIDLAEDDSEFVSTSSSSFSSASSFVTASPSPSAGCRCSCANSSISSGNISHISGSDNGSSTNSGGDISPISVELKEILDEKLSVLYRFCGQTKGLIKDYQVKFEELPIHCRFEDLSSLNFNLEKLRAFRKEVEEKLGDRLERCKMEMETVLRYQELLMPSEDVRMTRELEEMDQLFSNLYQDIGFEMEGLENFSTAYQKLQQFLQERISRFSVIKTRLVQVERNLVKDEAGLSLRLKGIQSILSVLERDHDSSENSEISRLLTGIRLYDYIDVRRILSQTQDLIQQEKTLLEEVKQKRVVLLEAKKSYCSFEGRIETFQNWYNDYMIRLSQTKVTGPDFDREYPSLVKEREEKRKEFTDILASARNLRASIFDTSAVDEKIEILQGQWKLLVDKVYKARSRKTV